MSLINDNRRKNDPREYVEIIPPPPPPPTVPTGLEADPSLASQIPEPAPEPTVADVLTPAKPSLQQKIQMYGGEFPTPESQIGFETPPNIEDLDPQAIVDGIDLSTNPGTDDTTEAVFSGTTVQAVEENARQQALQAVRQNTLAGYTKPAEHYITSGSPTLFEGATAADLYEWQQKFSQFTSKTFEEARRENIVQSFQPNADFGNPARPNLDSTRNPVATGGIPGMIQSALRAFGNSMQETDEFDPFRGYKNWWEEVRKNPWKIITAPLAPIIASTQGKYGEFGSGWWGSAIYTISLPENIVKGGLTDLANIITGNKNPESNTPNIVQAIFGQNYDFSQDANSERPIATVGGDKLPQNQQDWRNRSWIYRLPGSGLLQKTPLGIITGGDRTNQQLPETVNIPILGERPTVNVLRTSEFLTGLVLDAISGTTDNVLHAAGNRIGSWLFPNSPNKPATHGVSHSTVEQVAERVEKAFPDSAMGAAHGSHPKIHYGELVTPPELPPAKPTRALPGTSSPELPPARPTRALPGTSSPDLPQPPRVEAPPGALTTRPIQGEIVEVPVGQSIVQGSGTFGATNVIIDAETVRPLLPEATPEIIPRAVLTPPVPASQMMDTIRNAPIGSRVNPESLVQVYRDSEQLTALARFMGDVPPNRQLALPESRIAQLGSNYPPGMNPYARFGTPIPVEKLTAPAPVVQISDNLVATVAKDPVLVPTRPVEEVLTEFFEGARRNRWDSEFTNSIYDKFKLEGDTDKALLRIYQSGEFYKPINAYLRGGRAELDKYIAGVVEGVAKYGDEVTDYATEAARAERAITLIPYLQEVLSKQPLVFGTYHRNIGGVNPADLISGKYKIGEFVDEDAFTAVSRDKRIAGMFSGRTPDDTVKFEITGAAYSLPSSLNESVFPPGSKFRVDAIDKIDGVTTIKMSQVSPETLDLLTDEMFKTPKLAEDAAAFQRMLNSLPDELKVSEPKLLQQYLDLDNVSTNLELDVTELIPEVVTVKNKLVNAIRQLDDTPNVGRRNALDAIPFEPSSVPGTTALNNIQQPINNLPSQVWYHGSKVRNLDINNIDPIVGSARHELGVGLYLTDNATFADDYARAVPHRNLPPVSGRDFDEVGSVFQSSPQVVKPILANDKPPMDVHEAFLESVAEVFTAQGDITRGIRRSLGVKAPKKKFRDYYTTLDEIVNKVAGNMDFPEAEVLQLQRIVADKLRVMGYDSILDTSTTDNILVLLNPQTANATKIKDIGSGSLVEQAAARYNAASTTAAHFGGKNKVLNTQATEASVTLQTRIAQQTIENFDEVAKRAEDATEAVIEKTRELKRQAQAEAPKRKSQARRKRDAQNENQIRQDSVPDKNPCI
jgi:hypothetical protein